MCDPSAHHQCGCQSSDQSGHQSRQPTTQDSLSKEKTEPTSAGQQSSRKKVVNLHENVLAKNDRYATRNRILFEHLLMVNVLSSPGSGKTTLIQRLLRDISKAPVFNRSHAENSHWQAGVIVGDLATERDADRLRQTGAPAVQITTGNLCHLEAHSVAQAAKEMGVDNLDLLIVENVGNLVCPAAYDLGEDLRIVLMSVPEGEDKPLKYPTMFKSANLIVISKIDLAKAVGFKRTEALQGLMQIAPQARIFEVSAVTGQGLESLYAYLAQALAQKIEGRALAQKIKGRALAPKADPEKFPNDNAEVLAEVKR